jgi:hypothetical protein
MRFPLIRHLREVGRGGGCSNAPSRRARTWAGGPSLEGLEERKLLSLASASVVSNPTVVEMGSGQLQANFVVSVPFAPKDTLVFSYTTHDESAKAGKDYTAVSSPHIPGTTTTRLSANPNPTVVGLPVTFTATVAGAGTPTGTVTFQEGRKTLGTGTLNVVNGVDQATFITATLKAGTHSITAVYGGDTNNGASTSGALTLVVNPPGGSPAPPGTPLPPTTPVPPNPPFIVFGPGKPTKTIIRVPVATEPGFHFPKRFVLEVDGPGRVAYGVATIIWRHPRIPHPRVSNPVVIQPFGT